MKKYIIWSYDHEERQTFVDIYHAENAEHARRIVERERPYAYLDSVVDPMLLEEYIAALQKELAKK